MRNKVGQIRGEKNGGRLGCEASENQKLRLRIFAHPRKIGIRRPCKQCICNGIDNGSGGCLNGQKCC